MLGEDCVEDIAEAWHCLYWGEEIGASIVNIVLELQRVILEIVAEGGGWDGRWVRLEVIPG